MNSPPSRTRLVALLLDLPKALEPRYLQKAQRRLGMNRRELRSLMRGQETALDNGDLPTLAKIKNGRLTFLDEPLGNFQVQIQKEEILDDGLNAPQVRYIRHRGSGFGREISRRGSERRRLCRAELDQ